MNFKQYNVLIIVPNLKRPGGVSSLFNTLINNGLNDVKYFSLRVNVNGHYFINILEILFLVPRFILSLYGVKILHFNPSFNKKSFIRDSILVLIALFAKKKIVVYWHGWDSEFNNVVLSNKYLNFIFSCTFAKAKAHIVLGNIFKEKLIQLNVDFNNVFIESNCADDRFIRSNRTKKIETYNFKKEIVILFIARIERSKGIFIALDTIKFLSFNHSIKLIIAGDGTCLNEAIVYARTINLNNVHFLGHVNAQEKHQAFMHSDILLFPTSYPEGMPISILEAVLYGLPIITRPVGGIQDWIVNGENGFLVNSLDSFDFAKVILNLLSETDLFQTIHNNNINKGQMLFTPSAFIKRLFFYYQNVFNL